MINLNKSLEFFDSIKVTEPIHIIGLGAIGSHVAEQLVRLGLTNFLLYDFDEVNSHNIANQMYLETEIGMPKLEATAYNMNQINSDCNTILFAYGYKDQALSGYVFLCVDNIELRKAITEKCMNSQYVKAIFDFRMGLGDAQHYAELVDDEKSMKKLLSTMQFSHDEAKEATPVSACGTTLSVIPTVKIITAVGIANFINFVKGKALTEAILIDTFNFEICKL
jgi:molybdopterin/thiamine biosynthesis adenylyltransferase